MKEKIRILLEKEGLRPIQFAEIVGIKSGGVSHLLSGRNKPSYDLIRKILLNFPRINPDWLLLDASQMYRSDTDPMVRTASASGMGLPGSSGSGNGSAGAAHVNGSRMQPASLFPETDPNPDWQTGAPHTETHTGAEILNEHTMQRTGNRAAVERVVIFYSDLTFESFTPTKR